jgi:glutamate formiminotransferase
MNINVPDDHLGEAKATARDMRIRREQGDTKFAGVRALGLSLERRKLTQVSMNLTQPDRSSPDEIIDFVNGRLDVVSTELVGVIRPVDLPKSTKLPVEQEQIVS